MNKPKVSIGMAVYNEEEFIEKSIKSLLSQTYENFEIIISDNCSTDNTRKICKKYLAKDNRISYSRNKENLGSIVNFNKVLEKAKGKYFMWASGHDLWDKDYIKKCVDVLENDKRVVVCHARARDIDLSGKFLSKTMQGLNVDSQDPYTRVHDTIYQLSLYVSYAIYGLIRLKTLKKIKPVQETSGSDHINLIDLSYHGHIIQIKKPLYYARMTHVGKDVNTKSIYKRRYSPKKKHYLYLPQTILFFNYLKTIRQLPFSFSEKIKLYLYTTKMFGKTRARRIVFGEFLRMIIGEKNLRRLRKLKKSVK